MISFLTSTDSAVNSPCFRAFLYARAPCMRHTLAPLTAGVRADRDITPHGARASFALFCGMWSHSWEDAL